MGVSDFLFVQVGTNDVDECFDSDAIANVVRGYTEIMEKSRHTNTIISTIPFRYKMTCFNGVIAHINERLYNIAQTYTHVNVFTINNILYPRFYSSDGLHLNNFGKGIVCDYLKQYFIDTHGVIDKSESLHDNMTETQDTVISSGKKSLAEQPSIDDDDHGINSVLDRSPDVIQVQDARTKDFHHIHRKGKIKPQISV